MNIKKQRVISIPAKDRVNCLGWSVLTEAGGETGGSESVDRIERITSCGGILRVEVRTARLRSRLRSGSGLRKIMMRKSALGLG